MEGFRFWVIVGRGGGKGAGQDPIQPHRESQAHAASWGASREVWWHLSQVFPVEPSRLLAWQTPSPLTRTAGRRVGITQASLLVWSRRWSQGAGSCDSPELGSPPQTGN